jgi:hypothetical protein
MRPTNMRCSRTVRITAGALAIAAPVSAVALTAGQADALNELQIKPATDHLGFGRALTVTGVAPRSDGGYRLALEFSADDTTWRTLTHTKVHSDGAFRLRAPLTRSGAVRVVPVTPPAPAPAVDTATTPPPSPAPIAASQPEPVAVAAKLAASTGPIDALAGQPMKLRGTLLPRRPGAVVRLQARHRRRWRTVAVARTHRGGRFVLRHVERASSKEIVRLSFAGDAGNAAASTPARKLISLRPAVRLPRRRRRRQQEPSLRHQGHLRLPRTDGERGCRRSRPLCPRTRVRPQPEHGGRARLRRRGHGLVIGIAAAVCRAT